MTDDESSGKLTDLQKLAVSSVIDRQKAVVELMRHTDMRAQALFSTYVGFSGAILAFLNQGSKALNEKLYALNFWLLIFAALSLFAGCIIALLAGRRVSIGLPSRDPMFWDWALNQNKHPSEAVQAFLEEAQRHLNDNADLQNQAAKMLVWSRVCGAIAVAFIAAAIHALAVARVIS